MYSHFNIFFVLLYHWIFLSWHYPQRQAGRCLYKKYHSVQPLQIQRWFGKEGLVVFAWFLTQLFVMGWGSFNDIIILFPIYNKFHFLRALARHTLLQFLVKRWLV